MEIPFYIMIPFVVMLLSIAIVPLFAEEWWESNTHKLWVSLALGIPVATWLIAVGESDDLIHQMIFDYVPFILLLMALFVVTGGIHVAGNIQARPSINLLFLGIGWILASLMGTTGAAMLLIRPLLSTNSERKYKAHTVIFFIFVVANAGGLLTPLGDPPLFLLFQKGAEFTWFLHLLPQWLTVGVILLTIYYLLDKHYYAKEDQEAIAQDETNVEPLRFTGLINIVWLLCIVMATMFINGKYIPAMNEEDAAWYIKLLREFVFVGIIIASMLTTKKQVRIDNKYSWAPIIEVAVLFIGIFATMTPALMYLEEASFRIHLPWQYFYSTGGLSAFLDNAPTALVFHAMAHGIPSAGGLVAGVDETLLEAISCGAVFFGAMTYIGNGPNFMVKAIAEQSGTKMPSFFHYIIKYSLIYLLPTYVIVQLIFF
ncbi:MAG: sodium:proton antiporter [Bacteroidales bacterium]|nr:sodium:proton antiporter [Bacteroidales bacterium]